MATDVLQEGIDLLERYQDFLRSNIFTQDDTLPTIAARYGVSEGALEKIVDTMYQKALLGNGAAPVGLFLLGVFLEHEYHTKDQANAKREVASGN